MANRFTPGCCCKKCLLFQGYLPWAYPDDTAREDAGWLSVDGLWEHPRPLPKDDWQVVSQSTPNGLGVWEMQPAAHETPLVPALEVRGRNSGDLLVRIASVWVTDAAGEHPGLRVTIEDRDYDFVYLAEHTLAPAYPGSWGTEWQTDFEWLRFGTPLATARPTICRLAKRAGSVYVEFLRGFSSVSVLPIHSGSVVYPSPPVIDSPVPLAFDFTGEAAMAIPLASDWDEPFRLLMSPELRPHYNPPATRKTPVSSNIGAWFDATRIGVHGDPLDAEVTGSLTYQGDFSPELAGVRCANPGYVAAMPPHNELPTWTASLSGFDDCGVRHRATGHSHDSWAGPIGDPVHYSNAWRWDRICYRILSTYRPRYNGTLLGPAQLLTEHPSLAHPDVAGSLAGFNAVESWVAGFSGAFPDVVRDYSGPLCIRRATVQWTLDRTDGDDDTVDVVATVELHGDAQRAPEVTTNTRPFWFSGVPPGGLGTAPYRIASPARGLLVSADHYTSYQRLIYRRSVPRWTGELPALTLGADDLQHTESSDADGLDQVDQPIYWLTEYYWSGTNGDYELLPTNSWRVWWDETVRTRGVDVAPLLKIHLAPSTFRP